jgi:Rod binding domain-containing protein
MNGSEIQLPSRPMRPLDRISPAAAGKGTKVAEQAQRWVAQTFFGTLLKQIRNSPFKSEIFSGGRGGQAFGPLFDQNIVDRIAHGAGSKLTQSIVRRIAAKAYAAQSPSAVAPKAASLPLKFGVDGDSPTGARRNFMRLDPDATTAP